MATIKDVARLAGVSPSTVSKYLNGGTVRDGNLDAIRDAIDRLDYRVNPFARSLKTQRSRSVGILLPELSAPFFSLVFIAADRLLREHGYHSMISCYYGDYGLERDYLQFLMGAGVDGLLYMPEHLSADEFRELTVSWSAPVVQVDRAIAGTDTDTVLVENREWSCEAVCRLIERGHRRIAVVGGASAVLTARERLAGYLQALEQNGILYDSALARSGELTFTFGHESSRALMALDDPPTAIFSTNHDITMGVITAVRELGLRIPEDVDVFGYDCVSVYTAMSPPLPVVHQPEREIGRTAAACLIDRLNGYEGPSRHHRLPCELVCQ